MRVHSLAKPFEKTAPYYDLIYKKRGIRNDVKIISGLLRLNSIKMNHFTLLDIGCGTGTFAIEFYRQGFDVTGIDISNEMITIAKQKSKAKNINISFIHSDLHTYKPTHKYNAAVSLFDVLSYMTSNEQVLSFFHKASEVLKKNSLLIFDCWYGPGVSLNRPKIIYQKYGYNDLKVKRKKTPKVAHALNSVRIHHDLIIEDKQNNKKHIQEIHTMRYFFLPELEFFLNKAGFKLIQWGDLKHNMQQTIKPPWSICIVAKKN